MLLFDKTAHDKTASTTFKPLQTHWLISVNFTDCSQGVLRAVDAPPLLFRLNRALELIRCCEKEPCEIQTGSGAGSEGAPSGSDSPGETRWIQPLNPFA